jgi:ketosteroid isomerase-like protein
MNTHDLKERSMRKISAPLSLVIFLLAGMGVAHAGDAQTIDAIVAASAALDKAFEGQDADAIKILTTPDHVAVTPYYGRPRSVAEQIASLSELKYVQTKIGDDKITLLGPDAGLRTFTADLDGTFKGKPIPRRVFVTSVMVRRDGRWLETFYQITVLTP